MVSLQNPTQELLSRWLHCLLTSFRSPQRDTVPFPVTSSNTCPQSQVLPHHYDLFAFHSTCYHLQHPFVHSRLSMSICHTSKYHRDRNLPVKPTTVAPGLGCCLALRVLLSKCFILFTPGTDHLPEVKSFKKEIENKENLQLLKKTLPKQPGKEF